MNHETKIRGTLAMSKLTFKEMAQLCNISRQTIYNCLADPYMTSREGGTQLLKMSEKLIKLVNKNRLPLPYDVPKNDRIKLIKSMLGTV